MTRERQIEILIKDGCTRREADKHLDKGSQVYEDLEEHFDEYMKEWEVDEEEQVRYKVMISDKVPLPDWGVVEADGKIYYIMYSL